MEQRTEPKQNYYAYVKMLEEFGLLENDVETSVEKLTGRERLNAKKVNELIGTLAKKRIERPVNNKQIIDAFEECQDFYRNEISRGAEFETIEDKDATTQFTASVVKGKEYAVLMQIFEYFKTRVIEPDTEIRIQEKNKKILYNQMPEVTDGRIRLKTTAEHADGLAAWLEDPRVQGRPQNEMYITEDENPWLGGAREGTKIHWSEPALDENSRKIWDKLVHPEQVAEQSAVLVKQYIDELGEKRGNSNRDSAATFNLADFEKFTEQRAKNPKLCRDKDEVSLNQSVLKNVKTKKEEFQQTAFEQYKKRVVDIINKGRNTAQSEYSWALEQFKSAKYVFSEMNKDGMPTRFAIRGELLIGGGEFNVAAFDFSKSDDIKDIKHGDMKDVLSEHASKKKKVLKKDGFSAKTMTKINEDPHELCNRIQHLLGYNKSNPLRVGHEYNFGEKEDGIKMFRKILYMLRESNQTKTEEKQTEQGALRER